MIQSTAQPDSLKNNDGKMRMSESELRESSAAHMKLGKMRQQPLCH